MNAEPVLALRDLEVEREGRPVAVVGALDLRAGETLAVLGPNGAGKTSLLLAVAGLLRPRGGHVLLDGRELYDDPLAGRRRLAVAFQEPLLLDRSVRSNVELGLALRGVPRDERRERALTWLKRFGVSGLAERRALSLSGGEARRASLARAFALEPRLLLLDEPLASIDEPSRQAILGDLQLELEETGLTTMLVTHDREEARRLASRVAVMLGGRIVQEGPTEAVFAAPATIAVAAFLGIENLLPGRVLRFAEGLAEVDCGGPRLLASGNPGTLVYACFPAEAVSLSTAAEDEGLNRWKAVVERVVRAGPLLRVRLAGHAPLEAVVTVREAPALGLATGVTVTASVDPHAIHLLPR